MSSQDTSDHPAPHRSSLSNIFNALGLSKTGGESLPPCWQAHEIKFDTSSSNLNLRPGEHALITFNNIEDTKGNNGTIGRLTVTELRIIWVSSAFLISNLSIGHSTITSIKTTSTLSKLRGKTTATHITALFEGTKFEFIFTDTDSSRILLPTPSTITTPLLEKICSIWKTYTTSPYTHTLLTTPPPLLQSLLPPTLVPLPNEIPYETHHQIHSLAKQKGTPGTLFITNIRLVWCASGTGYKTVNDVPGISIPWIQMTSVRTQPTSYGPALTLQTSPYSKSYLLGFRIDPPERFKSLSRAVKKLWRTHYEKPVWAFNSNTPVTTTTPTNAEEEGNGGVVERDEESDAEEESGRGEGWKAYSTGVASESKVEVIYDPWIGLAVQKGPNIRSLVGQCIGQAHVPVQ
ncbi:Bardet-Biedl syndrome 5 protein [Rhizophlyctis rosea]|uniref:Bardet-Biedl syndrome 5 protein n=1 Tax=Rhizophlyctis rosea TaxID=64517 RepID=A0AAD5S1Y7_9FUNG|nr:Bardet-Biedl syndrome 5 protein [Rhizophlyctis rosea]